MSDSKVPSETVQAGKETAEVEIRLRPAGRLEGHVAGTKKESEQGNELHYVILLKTMEGQEGPPLSGRHPGESVSVDRHGSFRQSSLAPGLYRLTLRIQEFRLGKTQSLGPTDGFVGHKNIGEPLEVDVGEVEIRAFETATVNAVAP